jgi:DNA-binding NtrC family response regulator
MSTARILLVDDEKLLVDALTRVLERGLFEVVKAANAAQALSLLRSERIDVVVSDVNMPGIDGIELVRQIHELEPELPCIVLTGFGSGERSFDALRAGAFWYLEKGARDLGGLVRRLVAQALERRRLRSENRALKSELRTLTVRREVVGNSAPFRAALELAQRVAQTDSTVLITGESGTGKEVIARIIHESGPRAARLLVSVNCAALPDELLEAELFGHVRGAFTHAVASREGRFALADGGTLFLDEVGEMAPRLQAKLLRVLQERCFEPVGSSSPVRVDVRVVAATNQDLLAAIRERRFREDLYYRLAVIPIELPPLRERPDDVALLAHHFLGKKAEALGVPAPALAPAVLERLSAYEWPGNVRELENLMERLVVFARGGTIGLESLGGSLRTLPLAARPQRLLPEAGVDLEAQLRDFETELIRQALERTGWNKQRAAALLKLSRPTLFTKIQRAGLRRPAAAGGLHGGGGAA